MKTTQNSEGKVVTKLSKIGLLKILVKKQTDSLSMKNQKDTFARPCTE